MVVRKILETTLVAGSTSVTFNDTDISNSLLRVYTTKASLFPISQTLSGNTLSVNYKAQTTNVGVALEIVKQGLDIVDNIVTEDATKALSANQGVVLKDLIDGLSIPDNITDLDDVSISSIQNGQVLAWNSSTEKFENVNQSGGGGSNIYSTNEVVVGEYNGKPLYRKMIQFPVNTNELVTTSIYHKGYYIADYISNVEKLFPDAIHSFIDLGSGNIRGFLSILGEDDVALDVYTVYSRSGTGHICCEYTKTTD